MYIQLMSHMEKITLLHVLYSINNKLYIQNIETNKYMPVCGEYVS